MLLNPERGQTKGAQLLWGNMIDQDETRQVSSSPTSDFLGMPAAMVNKIHTDGLGYLLTKCKLCNKLPSLTF